MKKKKNQMIMKVMVIKEILMMNHLEEQLLDMMILNLMKFIKELFQELIQMKKNQLKKK